MANASQDHKLNVHGSNSLGGRRALAVIRQQHGSDTVPATVALNGLWGTGDTITVTINIGAGDLTPAYTPAADEDAFAAATGLAVQIALQTDVSCTAAGGTVFITKTTAGTVDVVSVVIA
jgi:hypothetical protein